MRAHILLEQEPQVLQCVRFLRAEVLLELESPAAALGDWAFGLPESSDVLLCVCQAEKCLSEHMLLELQGYVRDATARLLPGCRCFLYCDCFCGREGAEGSGSSDGEAFSRLRLRVFLYADLVIDLGGEGKSPYKKSVSYATLTSFTSHVASLWSNSSRVERVRSELSNASSASLFGPTASIPEEQRGRVSMERLVSMAKAAMVGEGVPIDQLFLSRNPAVRASIRMGARALSQASLGAGGMGATDSEELGNVLDSYLSLMPSSQGSAREAAGSFFAQLASDWNLEANLQQTRFARFVRSCLQSAKDYAMNWLTLSPERVQAIKAGGRSDPVPLLIVGVLPVVIVVLVFAVPYNRPDAGHPTSGLLQNPLFAFYCWPVTQFPCWFLFPEWVRMSAFPEMSRGRACLWNVSSIILVSLSISAFSVATGIFPVPFLTVVNITGIVPFLPFIWYCIPREVRQRPDSKYRLLWSCIGLAMVIAIFGVFFPLFNAVFHRIDGIYQDFLVGIFLFTRLLFENINKMLAQKLGSDMFPIAVMMAVYAYEFSMCVMMSNIKHTIVLVMLISADVCENAFHLWRLWRTREGPGAEGNRLCIVSVVLLREFVELAVPIQVVMVILAVHSSPGKQFNELVSGSAEGFSPELTKMLIYLAIDIAAEAVVFIFACGLLMAQGLKPLRLLRGVLAANVGSYFSIALACVMFYLQLQHSHFGCDFSFKFLWLSQEEHVYWSHGTEWSV